MLRWWLSLNNCAFGWLKSSKLEVESHLKMATYNTLGAIALQGVRQADLRLGETCAVIGMGLLGQLTAVLLSASGVKVIGIDINQELVELGRNHCLDIALVRDDPGIESKIQEFTNGVGCDAVIYHSCFQYFWIPLILLVLSRGKKGQW